MPQYPMPTGQVATILGVSERQLGELLRKRQFEQPPPVMAGRRLWSAAHVIRAGELLGVMTPPLRDLLAAET